LSVAETSSLPVTDPVALVDAIDTATILARSHHTLFLRSILPPANKASSGDSALDGHF
jgi:hypothetical protein